MEVNVYLYLRTCIFWLYMFIMILWKKDAYSSKSESAQRNQELQLGHVSEVACGSHPGEVSHGRRHQRRLARIRRGMCASGKRVGNRHGASAKACTHKPWRVRIDWESTAVAGTHRPTTGDIGQGLHEKPWCVRIWQMTSANGTQHQPRPTCISRGLHASAG